jgi:hypothetical protein
MTRCSIGNGQWLEESSEHCPIFVHTDRQTRPRRHIEHENHTLFTRIQNIPSRTDWQTYWINI